MSQSILVIEDHTSFFEYYTQVFKDVLETPHTLIHAKSHDEAKNSLAQTFDLAIIDIVLESTGSPYVHSGKDLALYLRENAPQTPIIISSTIHHQHLIHDIMTSVKPKGFLIKSDFDHKECVLAFSRVLEGAAYYSETIVRYMKSLAYFEKSTTLTFDDYHVLLLMKSGYSSAMIANHIGKSIRTVEYAKTKMKDILGLERNTEIIPTAIERGFI